jgi:hypothetical protein
MPCRIIIRTVNGVVPIGGTQPTRLRVTGIAIGCPGGVLLSSSVTAPMTVPAAVDPNDRFLIDVPITGQVNCGDPVGVTVTCAADSTCFATRPAQPLECCDVQIVTRYGVVPQGSLVPTAIRVTGTLYGCASDQVAISVPNVTAPRTVAVDPVTGSFDEQLPVTAPGFICGTLILVTAECAQGPAGCRAQVRETLACPQCFRAQISASAGPCTGSPPQATVTLTAQIGLPANGSGQFVWDYGDSSQSAPFTVTIASGTPGAFDTVNDTHPYQAGAYTVELRRIDIPECPPVQLTFTVTCNRCPQVTASAVVGACEQSGPYQGSRPVTYTLTFTPPLGATDTAYATISYGGPDVNGVPSAGLQRTGPGALTHTAYLNHKPGGYSSTVSVTILDAGNVALCVPPISPISFSTRPPSASPGVDVDPCLPCPTAIQVLVSPGSPPLPPPHRQFEATVVWPAPAPPPSPVAYDWTVTLPDGRQAKIVSGPAIVTTQPQFNWIGTGATGGAVDLSQGGTYGVSVTAKYAANAGLPTDPVTGVTSCNLTGPSSFPITGTPPTCPQITGVSVTSPDCADETQNRPATIGFAASVQNPAAVSGPYQWDFGDSGSPSNVTQTSTPTAQHVYATPSTYTVTVSLAATTNCPETSAQGTVTIGRCPCPEGQTRDSVGNCMPTNGDGGGGDEGFGCMLLRWIGVLLIMLGMFAFIIWLCVPGLPPWASWLVLGIAIGLVAAGIIVLAIWAAVCPIKPCLWGVLLTWQILLGFGLVCLYLTMCCLWLWIVGGLSIFAAAILLGIWVYRCQPTFCQIIIELAPVLTNVIALIGVVATVPILSACLNPAVGAVVSGVSAGLVLVLAACAAAGTTTRTGTPVS